MDSGIENIFLYSVRIFLYSVFLYGVSTVYIYYAYLDYPNVILNILTLESNLIGSGCCGHVPVRQYAMQHTRTFKPNTL